MEKKPKDIVIRESKEGYDSLCYEIYQTLCLKLGTPTKEPKYIHGHASGGCIKDMFAIWESPKYKATLEKKYFRRGFSLEFLIWYKKEIPPPELDRSKLKTFTH